MSFDFKPCSLQKGITMEFILASNNAHKVEEMKAILASFFSPILSLAQAGIDIDVLEDGNTFEENAKKKALAIAAIRPDCAIMADDSGLCVDALQGAPGVYSARFAGAAGDTAANNQKLLAALQGVPAAQRGAHFVTAIALYRPNHPLLLTQGRVDGQILDAPRGTQGFGYDPLFWEPVQGLTFAEMDAATKNADSHRARALQALLAILADENPSDPKERAHA